MPLRAPHPTAQATVPTPSSPVSMEAAVWSATATTHVTVTSRLLTGHIATTVSAAGYRRAGSHRACREGRERRSMKSQHQGKLWSRPWAPEL